MEGLQEKYGEVRVTDTGIRETTIIGQGIGLALRGFRPIAEIQYFDYLLYGLQTASDDLSTLHYRTRGGQAAPHDHPYARTPTGRDLAFGFTPQYGDQCFPRYLCLCAPRHDTGCRIL